MDIKEILVDVNLLLALGFWLFQKMDKAIWHLLLAILVILIINAG